MRVLRIVSLATLFAGAVAACSTQTDAPNAPQAESPLNGDAFVPVYRSTASSALKPLGPTATQNSSSFYLAINKAELGKKWFLSAFMKQFFPGAVTSGAARSIGTRVVSFKVQNGKLFVFDVDDNKKTSETFNPEVVVEAYPIVSDPAFRTLPGANNYVLFDPSAGLNRFTAVSDAIAWNGTSFAVELMFNQNFRTIADGVTFEQVFTGYTTGNPVGDGALDPNPLRGQGTLGIALRRYAEGQGFQNRPFPKEPHYFTSDPKVIPNTGETEVKPIRWNIHPGMTPIRWTISHRAQVTQDDPKYAAYDIIGAIKHGIEDWNEVFGFPVFEAVVGQPNDSFADDDKNFIIWDEDPSYGAAFANWRTNPNTGEIRGASVYMNIMWLQIADGFKDDAPADSPTGASPAPSLTFTTRPKPATTVISWSGGIDTTACVLWAPPFRASEEVGNKQGPRTNDTGKPLTKAQKVFNYIKNTMLHEIGHDLGLRHNFKGSLSPISSSVMDYLDTEDSYYHTGISEYDRQAIKYLYHLSDDLPTAAFCTDQSTKLDPECNRFDSGASPYDYFLDLYKTTSLEYANLTSESPPNLRLNRVLQFVRAGKDSATRQMAWADAISFAKVLPAGTALPTGYDAARVDKLAERVFRRLYLDDTTLRGDITQDPTDPDVISMVTTELRGNLLNTDGIRSWATRRTTVDVLKKLQTASALSALKDAEADLQTKLPTLSGSDANDASDLLARIKTATSPYYTK